MHVERWPLQKPLAEANPSPTNAAYSDSQFAIDDDNDGIFTAMTWGGRPAPTMTIQTKTDHRPRRAATTHVTGTVTGHEWTQQLAATPMPSPSHTEPPLSSADSADQPEARGLDRGSIAAASFLVVIVVAAIIFLAISFVREKHRGRWNVYMASMRNWCGGIKRRLGPPSHEKQQAGNGDDPFRVDPASFERTAHDDVSSTVECVERRSRVSSESDRRKLAAATLIFAENGIPLVTSEPSLVMSTSSSPSKSQHVEDPSKDASQLANKNDELSAGATTTSPSSKNQADHVDNPAK